MGKNSISINVPDMAYFGGEVVYGIVELQAKKQIKNRGIQLCFCAYEQTKCDREEELDSKEMRIFILDTSDFYVDGTAIVEGKTEVIPPGTHRIPFAYALPLNLPASFRSKCAVIEYKISVNIDIPMKRDLSAMRAINVSGNVFDEVYFASSSSPVRKEDTTTILFMGKIKGEVRIQKSNFYCGDALKIEVDVKNDSKKKVQGIKASVEKVDRYAANKNRSESSVAVGERIFNVLVPKKSMNSFSLDYVIPKMGPTIEPHGPITQRNISSSLALLIVLDIPMWPDLEIRLPIRLMDRRPKRANIFPLSGAYQFPARTPARQLEFVDYGKNQTPKVANWFFKAGMFALETTIDIVTNQSC